MFLELRPSLFINDESGVEVDLPDDLYDRYYLALLEWESVQDELEKFYKEEDIS